MTTKILTGSYASGYTFGSPITTLSVTSTGSIGGTGLQSGSGGAYSVINDGTVNGQFGIYLRDGGAITNGAPTARGAEAVGQGSGLEVRNAPGVIVNYGTAIATTNNGFSGGAYVGNGGTITNGSGVDTTATLEGGFGVLLRGAAGGAVVNFGTVIGTYSAPDFVIASVYVSTGSVTNGSSVDHVALIEGQVGVAVENSTGVGTVTNFGTILATTGTGHQYGVEFGQGAGDLVNGSATDSGALIQGVGGVLIEKTATVSNFGSIEAAGGAALLLNDGGSVTNGGAGDRTALIQGYQGVYITQAPGAVANFGTIEALLSSGSMFARYGVGLGDGGSVANGAANDRAALIQGYGGVFVNGAGGVSNFGAIEADGGSGGAGVYLNNGASLTNGTGVDRAALISGYLGVKAVGSGTVTNYGTIAGTSGVAVQFGDSANTLVVEAGAVFDGQVQLDSGTLDLASGAGALTVDSYGDVTVTGALPTTTFYGAGTLEIGAGAAFTLTGNATTTANLDVAGALGAAGTIAAGGSVTVTGSLSGAGTLALQDGGQAAFDNGASLTITKVTLSGAPTTATVNAAKLVYAGLWTQSAATLSVATGDEIDFTGAGDSFAGTLAGAGTVAFAGGTDSLAGTTIGGHVLIDGAAASLSGTLDDTGAITLTSSTATVAAAGVSLTGGGTITLTSATSEISGATAAAKLTNIKTTILGEGLLGGGELTLINDATIEGKATGLLTLDTGAATIVNAGLIESDGAGGVTIKSAVDNTGTLTALIGTLTALGSVTGAGTVSIHSATAGFASGFDENVTFVSGSKGELELGDSQAYGGTITGFSTIGATSLDLGDIKFVSGTTTAVFSGTASGGTLTVKSGAEVATIHLKGNYLSSTFTPTSDGHGGTLIEDPTHAGGHVIQPLGSFAQAMAGLAQTNGAGDAAASLEPRRGEATLLAPPRAAIA
jgi:hypothetical protein